MIPYSHNGSQFKASKSDATLTLTNMNTMHLIQNKKGLFKACNGLSSKTRFDKWLITTRCREFTYCLCNFIWLCRSHTFMFIRLRALFKSSVLIRTET
ncbi:hypothetical protein H5410_030636 [Solanum commersonii]|uniref:Uncharacterized protein n=1 Tax=Solanum commersonii TaxID=4109 RepID=A0A9J5YG70_SOLCO|nr:hypothetical protein H5410_030636 [Solanum commersonii]